MFLGGGQGCVKFPPKFFRPQESFFFFFGYRVVEEQIKQIGSGGGERGVCILTFWRQNYIFNFSTPSIKNVNNTRTKCVRFMKQTAF